MKPLISCILTSFLFLSPFRILLPSASAQGWVWGRASTGAGLDAWQVATDASGNIYGGGIQIYAGSLSFGGIAVPPNAKSVWVKYDPSGTVLWADGTISGQTYLENITTDPSGNLIVFGSFSSVTMKIGPFTLTNSYSGSASQYYLAKISPSGTVLWAINDGNITPSYLILSIALMSTGGVTTDAAGNIYITSSFNKSSMTIGSNTLLNSDPSGKSYDIFVAKYSPAGTLVWASSIGGNDNDYGFGITVSGTGYIYVAGAFYSASIKVGTSVITNPYANSLAFIAKFSSAGTPSWAQSAGGINGAFAVGLAKDNSGNIYMTGGFGDASISFGATTITRTYPAAAPQLALYLVQYSPSNVVTWSKTIGSPTQGVWGYCIALASCGQVWVSGNYNEKAVIDIGDTLALVTGRDPIFIAGYNLSGGTIGYSGLGAGGDDQNGIACDASGNVFICSDYSGTLTIGPDLLKGSILTEEFYIGKYVNTTTPPDSVIGLDTIKCIGSTGMTLTAPPGYTVYFWDDGSSLSSRFVTTAGKYYVYCITCGLPMLIDTFIVLPDAGIPPSVVTSAKDTSACSSVGAITLNVPAGYNADLWSTGSTAASIVVTSAGSYWIQCTRNCVILSDTFKVTFTPSPVVSLDNDTGFCSGNSITLTSAQPPGYTYLWNTGSISNSINVSQRGLYWLTVNNNGCIATDSINIAELFPPPPVNLGPDTVLCLDNILQLSAQAGTSPLSWSNGSNEQNMTVTETGTYWATLSNACGITSDTIKVDFEPCELWFPSAFTPNGDGRNDIIRVVGYLRFYKDFSLSIFNRFGQRVFFTEDINSGWDGNFNGSKQDLGTYFYLIYYSLEGKKHMMKGDIELIR